MRPATSDQLAAVASPDRRTAWRVYVDDENGTQVDWTDFVEAWEVTEDIENFVATASITFFREEGATTLAPFMTDPSNITIGRDVEIQVAVVEQDTTILASDWEPIFKGTIDDAEWASETKLVCPCRGLGRTFLKAKFQSDIEYGNASGTEPIENVLQDQIDDVLGSGVVTLVVEGSPDLGIFTEEIKRGRSLREAQLQYVDLIGWVVRYKWDETAQDWEYTLYEPDRDKTTPDHVFGPGNYWEITELKIASAEIRNKVEIQYDETNSIVVVDSDSIAEFGGDLSIPDYFYLDLSEDQQIDNATKATALGTAILKDLSQPRARQQTRQPLFPFVELGDFYRFEANNVHYDTDQDMAVTSFTHRLSADGAVETVLSTRGNPSGGASRWFRRRFQKETTRVVNENTPDPEIPDAELSAPSIDLSFEETGLLLSIVGDDPIQCFAGTGDMDGGATPAPAKTGVSTTLSADASAGAIEILVDDTTGFTADHLVLIHDGTNAEVQRILSVSSGTLRFSALSDELVHSYSAGATVEELDVRTGEGVGQDNAFFANSNPEIRFDPEDFTYSGGDNNSYDPAYGAQVEVRVVGYTADGTETPVEVVRRVRGDTESREPTVAVSATRDGSDVDCRLVISDPTLAATAVEFRTRDGDSDAAWSAYGTGWDTNTGTAGTDTSLTREEVTSDPTTAFGWRITWTDENGDSQEKEGEIDLASVQEIEKIAIVHASGLVPAKDSTSYEKDVNSGAWLRVPIGTTATQEFTAEIDLPPGVTVTNLAVRFNPFNTSDDMLTQIFDVDSSGSRGTIASIIYDGVATGWQTDSATVNEDILETRKYGVWVTITQQAASEVRWNWLEVTYLVPSFKQTV